MLASLLDVPPLDDVGGCRPLGLLTVEQVLHAKAPMLWEVDIKAGSDQLKSSEHNYNVNLLLLNTCPSKPEKNPNMY